MMFIEFYNAYNPRIDIALSLIMPDSINYKHYLAYNTKTERFYVFIEIEKTKIIINNSIYAKRLYDKIKEELYIYEMLPKVTIKTYLETLYGVLQ